MAIELSRALFTAAEALKKAGGQNKPVSVDKVGLDSSTFGELKKKKVVSGTPQQASLTTEDYYLTKRGGKRDGAAPGRKGPKANISTADKEHIRTHLLAYAAAVNPQAQRLFEERRQNADFDSIAKRAREISAQHKKDGKAVSNTQAMTLATREFDLTFTEFIAGQFGELMVSICGIPDATDTKDEH